MAYDTGRGGGRCAFRRSGIATRGGAPLSYLRMISSSSISISSKTTGLPSPSRHHCAFRCRSITLSWKCCRFRCRPQLVLTTWFCVFPTRRPDKANVSATSCDVGFSFSVSYVVSLPNYRHVVLVLVGAICHVLFGAIFLSCSGWRQIYHYQSWYSCACTHLFCDNVWRLFSL